MECLPLLLAGMAMSTCGSGESVSQNAMVGMLTYADSRMGWWSVRGSVRTSSRGSSNAFWIWLVKVPVHADSSSSASSFDATAHGASGRQLALLPR
jgi:hypothetical protein